MTLRQRIEAVFRGEKPDAMVWFGDLTYWYASHSTIGDVPERWRGPGGIERLHRELNVGEYVPGCCAYDAIEDESVKVETETRDGVRTVWRRTPVGTLREVREYSPVSFSSGFIEHPAKTVEDLKVVRYIEARRRYRACPEKIAQVDRDYGDFGLPIVAVPATPLAELYKSWVGLIELSYLMADAPAEVEKTIEVMTASQDALYRITEESACPYVMMCENLSAESMGGFFDRYAGPYLTRRTAALHARGKKTIIHIDGTLRGVVEKIPQTGIDCIDAMTPKPVGDVGVDEIRDLVGERLLILGGLPGAMFAPPFGAREVERHVREIIRIHKDSGRFMLGVADQVPPNGDLNLVRLISDLVEEYGRY